MATSSACQGVHTFSATTTACAAPYRQAAAIPLYRCITCQTVCFPPALSLSQVELWTQPQHHVHSSVKKSRRNPKWKNQVLEVLVQEPDSQVLRVVMHDIDIFNPKVRLTALLLC